MRGCRFFPTVRHVHSIDLASLLVSAKDHAERALDGYLRDDRQATLIHTALAIELQSKAFLYSINPTLLMEVRGGSFDSLLHLIGHGDKASKPDSLRTIGATEALDRVARLAHFDVPVETLRKAMNERNSSIHAGVYDGTRVREFLITLLRYSTEMLTQIGLEVDWGKSADIVSVLMAPEEKLSENYHETNRKIAAARKTFDELAESMSPKILNDTIGTRCDSHRGLMRDYCFDDEDCYFQTRPTPCPSCQFMDAIYVHIFEKGEKLVLLKKDGEVCKPNWDLTPSHRAFKCPACDLDLQESFEVDEIFIIERSTWGNRYSHWRSMIIASLKKDHYVTRFSSNRFSISEESIKED